MFPAKENKYFNIGIRCSSALCDNLQLSAFRNLLSDWTSPAWPKFIFLLLFAYSTWLWPKTLQTVGLYFGYLDPRAVTDSCSVQLQPAACQCPSPRRIVCVCVCVCVSGLTLQSDVWKQWLGVCTEQSHCYRRSVFTCRAQSDSMQQTTCSLS